MMRLVQREMEACPACRDGGVGDISKEHLGYFFLFDLCIKSPPFPREDLGGFYLYNTNLKSPHFPNSLNPNKIPLLNIGL
ncbi:MAG: hypothetical protein IPH98_07505 [Saprospiraceae bacterium]|nr:hypothetical protein [Candidatus Defluviibacterium haderslevense]